MDSRSRSVLRFAAKHDEGYKAAKKAALSKAKKPPHYKVTSTDKSGTYLHGYTSSPKVHERESVKEGWKKGQLKYHPMYKDGK